MRHAVSTKFLFLAAVPLTLTMGLGIVAWDIASFGNQVQHAGADAAIVLGAAAWGGTPSPVYRERINEAISLYREGRIHWIIFTGGTPRPGYPTEGEVGRQFSVKHGVPPDVILVEMESRNTWQNLERARRLMAANGIHSALLVSGPLHLRRAMAIAIDLGIQA